MINPEKIFTKTPAEAGDPVTAKKLMITEILDDLAALPEDVQELVKKHFLEHQPLKPKEQHHMNEAISKWWKEKYGSDFFNKAARDELLFRKYAPETLEKIHNLQAELFSAIKAGDEPKLAQLKKVYLKKYPDYFESVEVLFGIRDFLLKQKDLNEDRERSKDRREAGLRPERKHREIMQDFRDLTEYQFLFTHFLLTHGEDREFLVDFWDAAEQIAKRLEMPRELNLLRRGQISQVATCKIMEQIGHRPTLSHPDEDAFSAVDLWSDEDTAIQIKGANLEQPALLSVDEVYFPAVSTETADAQNLYNSGQMREFQEKNKTFHTKIYKLGQQQHRKINGYMMIIPYHKIDFITGEPDQQVVDFFAEKIGSHDQKE